MADDWKVGDLALCVKVGDWLRAGTNVKSTGLPDYPKAGGVYRVRSVGYGQHWLALWLEELPGEQPGDAFAAIRFVKITPPAADEFDREVIEQMRPVSEPAA